MDSPQNPAIRDPAIRCAQLGPERLVKVYSVNRLGRSVQAESETMSFCWRTLKLGHGADDTSNDNSSRREQVEGCPELDHVHRVGMSCEEIQGRPLVISKDCEQNLGPPRIPNTPAEAHMLHHFRGLAEGPVKAHGKMSKSPSLWRNLELVAYVLPK